MTVRLDNSLSKNVADDNYVNITGDTMTGSLTGTNIILSGDLQIASDSGQLKIGAGTDFILRYDGSGTNFICNDTGVANSLGKLQFYGTYAPTGSFSQCTGNYFKGSIIHNLAAGTGSTTWKCNDYMATYQAPDVLSGYAASIIGTNFGNTFNGNTTALPRFGSWGQVTGVLYNIAYTGNYGGFGMNVFPMVIDIDFTANMNNMSHQISGMDHYITYNANNSINQFYGYRLVPEINGGAKTPTMYGYYCDIQTSATNAVINGDVEYYRAYLNTSYDDQLDSVISASNLKVIGFNVAPGPLGSQWTTTNHDTYGFYCGLHDSARNFSYVSSGANGWIKSDSGGFCFGQGSAQNYDAKVFYSATNMVINSSLINASDLDIFCGTEKTVELQNTVWNDINIGGAELLKAAANQPDQVSVSPTNIVTYAFDGGGILEELHGSFELMHDYKEGTNIYPHIHWYPTTTDIANVIWNIDYCVIAPTTATYGTLAISTSTTGNQWRNIYADSVLSGPNFKIGDQVHLRLWRDGDTTGDTYNSDAAVGTLGIHYEVNTMGSRTKLLK